jgi:hypothetical protein
VLVVIGVKKELINLESDIKNTYGKLVRFEIILKCYFECTLFMHFGGMLFPMINVVDYTVSVIQF